MSKWRLARQRGVVLIGISVTITALIASFIGFSYVNSKQKLATAESPAQIVTATKLSATDVKPIVDTTSIDNAALQLANLDAELTADQGARSLMADVTSITN